MSKSFTIFTERNNADSLAQPVKIGFALLPCPCSPIDLYWPILQKVMDFRANGEQTQAFQWDKQMELAFCESRISTPFSICTVGSYCPVPPRHSTRILQYGHQAVWDRVSPSLHPVRQAMRFITVANSTYQQRLVALGYTRRALNGPSRGYPVVEPLAFYQIPPGCICDAPSTFSLQVYDISGIPDSRLSTPSASLGYGMGGIPAGSVPILMQDDLRWPLLSSPVCCDVLPDDSIWKLCRDSKGALSLVSQNSTPVVMSPYPGVTYHSTLAASGHTTIAPQSMLPGRSPGGNAWPKSADDAPIAPAATGIGFGSLSSYHLGSSRTPDTPTKNSPAQINTAPLPTTSGVEELTNSINYLGISEQVIEEKHITICTSNHKPSRMLRTETQIVLTVTPADQSKLFVSQTPIAWKVLNFPSGAHLGKQCVWQRGIGFCTVRESERKVLTPALCAHVPLRSWVQLEPAPTGYRWSESRTLNNWPREEVKARNRTPTSTAIVLCSVEGTADPSSNWTFEPFLHCGEIPPGGEVTVGPPVMLQAYAVSDYKMNQLVSAQYKEEYILADRPERKPKPIDLRTLKKNTSFLLYTDHTGRLALELTWSGDD